MTDRGKVSSCRLAVIKALLSIFNYNDFLLSNPKEGLCIHFNTIEGPHKIQLIHRAVVDYAERKAHALSNQMFLSNELIIPYISEKRTLELVPGVCLCDKTLRSRSWHVKTNDRRHGPFSPFALWDLAKRNTYCYRQISLGLFMGKVAYVPWPGTVDRYQHEISFTLRWREVS